jgi:hypothetical protein
MLDQMTLDDTRVCSLAVCVRSGRIDVGVATGAPAVERHGAYQPLDAAAHYVMRRKGDNINCNTTVFSTSSD